MNSTPPPASDQSCGTASPAASSPAGDGARVIAVYLREWNQLFDSLDPSPFRDKDLDPDAEEYIVESLKEHPLRTSCELVLHVDQLPGPAQEEQVVAAAVHAHFARRSRVLQTELARLIHRGLISLAIGLGFLTVVFLIAHFVERFLHDSAMGKLLRESLVIVGWVAMWRPLDIFLYDWWPIAGQRRIHDRLSRIPVRVVYQGPRSEAVVDFRSHRPATHVGK